MTSRNLVPLLVAMFVTGIVGAQACGGSKGSGAGNDAVPLDGIVAPDAGAGGPGAGATGAAGITGAAGVTGSGGDVSLGGRTAPTCGDPGAACCAGLGCKGGGCCVSGICMAVGGSCVGLGGGVCNAGSCGECGAAGQPCCTSSAGAAVCTAPDTKCSNNVCAKCGELGGACCPNPAGGVGTCHGASAICSNDVCITCGTPGTACCPGNQCTAGCCFNNTCLGEGTACGSSGGTCQAGRCSGCGSVTQSCCSNLCYDGLLCKSGTCTPCGSMGETCCPAGGTKPACQPGTSCTGDVCARCGGLGDICCEGNTCNEGCCSGGRCLTAGSCSTPDAAVPTDAPLGGAGGAGGGVGSGGKTGSGGITSSGGTSGSGGITGTGGATSTTPGPCGDMVDDMEAGTGWICAGNGRVGFWFTYVDSYDSKSTITPTPNSVAKPELMSTPRETSTRAMHAYGTYTNYVGMGVLFNIAAEGATPKTYDASAYTGIKFWAKGSGSYLTIYAQMDTTASVKNGGTCSTVCSGSYYRFTSLTTSWTQFTLPFSYLTGGTVPFKSTNLWSIEFGPYCSSFDCPFDFWIDDLTLYK